MCETPTTQAANATAPTTSGSARPGRNIGPVSPQATQAATVAVPSPAETTTPLASALPQRDGAVGPQQCCHEHVERGRDGQVEQPSLREQPDTDQGEQCEREKHDHDAGFRSPFGSPAPRREHEPCEPAGDQPAVEERDRQRRPGVRRRGAEVRQRVLGPPERRRDDRREQDATQCDRGPEDACLARRFLRSHRHHYRPREQIAGRFLLTVRLCNHQPHAQYGFCPPRP